MSFNSGVETVQNFTATDVAHSTIHKDNVEVSSAVSHASENQVSMDIGADKIAVLMARLGTTHAQLDAYSQRRTQQISVETQAIISQILQETQDKQRQLLLDAQQESQALENQYRTDLQIKVNQLNEEKAQQLADLEKALNTQQETILINARQNIDQLQRDANARKMNILQEAQEKSNVQLERITEQVVAVGQEDSANRLASTTTTVITTQAVAQGETVYAAQGSAQTYSQVVQQS